MKTAFALKPDTGAALSRDDGRDPREDPQPDDTLAVGSDVRVVWDRVGDRVEYGFPGKSATRWLNLIQWQRWARNADVRKRG